MLEPMTFTVLMYQHAWFAFGIAHFLTHPHTVHLGWHEFE